MLVALTIKIKKRNIERGGESTARTKTKWRCEPECFWLKDEGAIFTKAGRMRYAIKKTTRFAGGFDLVISA